MEKVFVHYWKQNPKYDKIYAIANEMYREGLSRIFRDGISLYDIHKSNDKNIKDKHFHDIIVNVNDDPTLIFSGKTGSEYLCTCLLTYDIVVYTVLSCIYDVLREFHYEYDGPYTSLIVSYAQRFHEDITDEEIAVLEELYDQYIGELEDACDEIDFENNFD